MKEEEVLKIKATICKSYCRYPQICNEEALKGICRTCVLGQKPGQYIGVCPVCGSEFRGRSSKIYCSDACSNKAWNLSSDGKNSLTKSRRKARELEKTPHIYDDHVNTEKELVAEARQARIHGMTYGKWMEEKSKPHYNRETKKWEMGT